MPTRVWPELGTREQRGARHGCPWGAGWGDSLPKREEKCLTARLRAESEQVRVLEGLDLG